MRILIVYHSVIPAIKYGGTERVIWYLGKALVSMGHEVTYLVNEGSYCDFAKVIYIDNTRSFHESIPTDIDVIHFNETPPEPEKIKKPYVVTIHGNIPNLQHKFDLNTIFVSKNHATRHGSTSYVYNGLDWDDYDKPDFHSQKKYFHFLGKAAWRVKNVKGAISVIKGTHSERLSVLGGVRFNFKLRIRFTFSPRISFYGMVGGKVKDNLLKHSKGLIFPVKWHEPFGLAITESLYYGCPVFGTPYGSLPELVNEDVGFLSNKRSELTQAVEEVSKYSRKRCHEYVLEEFNSIKMAKSYLERYERVLDAEALNSERPKLANMNQPRFMDWIE